jgi:hypothetical protein
MSESTSANPTGPHAAIATHDARERFLCRLFDRLWDRYRSRVSYVRTYEDVIRRAGATFVNDHIAFRTFAAQRPQVGIVSLSRIFEALGYRPAGCYDFPDKQLSAIHYQHPHPQLPKLFISELRTWELDAASRATIQRTLAAHRPPLADDALASLAGLDRASDAEAATLVDLVVDWFHRLPWEPPTRRDVEALNAVSQYAAWVLVHGYYVNHFTSLIDSHGVVALNDIEKTSAALAAAGVPMKSEIEGERGSKLRQTATEAVRIDVDVRDDDGRPARMPWSYAYFELAQRPPYVDPVLGSPVRFEGFLGPQATQLFEMTRVTK